MRPTAVAARTRAAAPDLRPTASRTRRRAVPAVLALAGTLALAACDRPSLATEPPLDPETDARLRQALSRAGVMPIGRLAPQDPALVALGQALVFDPILSGNRDVSCATCHHPVTHGADGLSLSIGTGGSGQGTARTLGAGREFVPRNAPTLLNQGLRSFYMFWDARLSGHGAGPFQPPPGITFPQGLTTILAAQAMLPVLDRREMRGDPGDVDIFGEPNELAQLPDDAHEEIWAALMARLRAVPEYDAMFRAAFPTVSPGALDFRHAAIAMAAFITEGFTKADSPFDRYVAGDDAALDLPAKRGGLLFFGARAPEAAGGSVADDPVPWPSSCSSCHGGALLGGSTFANVGIPQLGPGTGPEAPLDLGRAGVVDAQHNEFYRFSFRAPPLRNVELTGPYMHNGAYPTLESVVRHYDDPVKALRDYDPSHLSPALAGLVHDDPAVVDELILRLDPRVREPLDLSEQEIEELVAFLRSLTDPAARDLGHLVPERVPSGLAVERARP